MTSSTVTLIFRLGSPCGTPWCSDVTFSPKLSSVLIMHSTVGDEGIPGISILIIIIMIIPYSL